MVAKAQALGPIKALVQAAGVSPSQAPIEAILKVDLYGTSMLLEEFGKVMAAGGSGVLGTIGGGISGVLGKTLGGVNSAVGGALATLAGGPGAALSSLAGSIPSVSTSVSSSSGDSSSGLNSSFNYNAAFQVGGSGKQTQNAGLSAGGNTALYIVIGAIALVLVARSLRPRK